MVQPRVTTLDPSKHTAVTVGEDGILMDVEDPDVSLGPASGLTLGQSSGAKDPQPPDKSKGPWSLQLRRSSGHNVKVLWREASKHPSSSTVLENQDSLKAHASMVDLSNADEGFGGSADGIEPEVALEA